MTPYQVARAVPVAVKDEPVAPRDLLQYLLAEEEPANLAVLSTRQREILSHVGEELFNAEIAKRLYLSESAIRQHLRAAYKLLGVNNRIEADNPSTVTVRPRVCAKSTIQRTMASFTRSSPSPWIKLLSIFKSSTGRSFT